MIATTIEQSQRLFWAGVDYSTADMMWNRVNLETDFYDYNSWELDVDNHHELEPGYIPAWSLSALWDLCKDYPLQFATCDESAEDVIACLVEHLIKNKK